MLADEEDALDVDVHHPVPVFLGRFEQLTRSTETGVVDEGVDAAQPLAGGLHHGFDRFRVAHVA